jgi:hypothetical protein
MREATLPGNARREGIAQSVAGHGVKCCHISSLRQRFLAPAQPDPPAEVPGRACSQPTNPTDRLQTRPGFPYRKGMDPLNRRLGAGVAWPLLLGLAACSSSGTSARGAAGTPEIAQLSPGGAAGVAASGASGVAASGAAGVAAGGASGTTNGAAGAVAPAGAGAGTLSGAIPIVAGAGADVPYQFGMNSYGIQGAAFFARSAMGTSSVVLDPTQPATLCLSGTVEMVPTPADGSHPPYSTYWGIDVGFNLNQSPDSDATVKPPWPVAGGVVGFWFTVEGATIPPIRFKTTPTGRDPAQEQDSCALVAPVSGVPTQIRFTDTYVQCWDGPQGTGTTDISQGLLDVGLQVAAQTDAPIPLDFCLTEFGVIAQ